MPYSHFGKQADVWKHLPLCQILHLERPDTYVETNSASAVYTLSHTPEQAYGIYHFMEKAPACKELSESVYFKLEQTSMHARNQYTGSPALAMSILGDSAGQFIFFDLEEQALSDIQDFASQHALQQKVKTYCRESVDGMFDLLPHLPANTFIHIDPYEIDRPNASGRTYLDVFTNATMRGMKCYLWYGFNTLDEKERLNHLIREQVSRHKLQRTFCAELTMDIIEKDKTFCNPGIIGSGLLAGNLTEQSFRLISQYAESLVNIYQNSLYKTHHGGLHFDMVR